MAKFINVALKVFHSEIQFYAFPCIYKHQAQLNTTQRQNQKGCLFNSQCKNTHKFLRRPQGRHRAGANMRLHWPNWIMYFCLHLFRLEHPPLARTLIENVLLNFSLASLYMIEVANFNDCQKQLRKITLKPNGFFRQIFKICLVSHF